MLPVLRRSAAQAARARVAAPVAFSRYYSQPSPDAKAKSIIDALPGNSVLSKSGILATGTAAAVYAVSNSLYVVNAETCLLAVFAAFITVASKTIAPAYKGWAEGHIKHITTVLNDARKDHVVAVQDRIDSVKQLDHVVKTTKDLFAASKATVETEAAVFKLKQEVDIAAKAKEVLDSWVRYESQVRAREQQELVQQVTQKVEAAIASDKFQAQALKQALEEVEKVFKA